MNEVHHDSMWQKWGSLGILSLALAIIIIDTTVLNVSLGTIIRDLKTNIQSLQWVITIYALILSAFTITGGRLGDLFGRKKMFVLGALIFAIGSFVASVSHHVSWLLLGEAVIEGVGAALMMPATASLLLATFRGPERAKAFGIWGGIAAASAAIGPILGGWLTTHYSWRWAFRINIFVAAAVLIGSILIKESRDTEHKPNLDIGGVILSGLGLLSLVFGIIESETYGWIKSKAIFMIGSHAFNLGSVSITVPAIIVGLILLAIFVWWEIRVERHGGTPLVSMSLFQNYQFSSGTITTGILGLGQSGLFFVFPIFFQAVRGLDALHTGIALLPMPIGVFITAPLAAALGRKIAPKRLIQLGFLMNGIGLVVMHASLKVSASAWHLAPGFLLYGLGMGMIMPHISNITLSAVPLRQAGEASGVNNTTRQLGATLGAAVMGAILLTAVSTNLANGVKASNVIPTPLKDSIAQTVSTQTSNVEFGGGAQTTTNLPAPITQEITTIGHTATTDGNKTSIVWALLFVTLGLAATLWLPDISVEHAEPAPTGH